MGMSCPKKWASWWLSSKECTCSIGAQETWVRSLGGEDPREEGMATHSHILAWTEEPGQLQSLGSRWRELA